MFITLLVLKLSMANWGILEQPLNIPSICITLLVSNKLIFRKDTPFEYENIYDISSTESVIKLIGSIYKKFKSKLFVLNICDMFLALFVLKWTTSNETKLSQLENI